VYIDLYILCTCKYNNIIHTVIDLDSIEIIMFNYITRIDVKPIISIYATFCTIIINYYYYINKNGK